MAEFYTYECPKCKFSVWSGGSTSRYIGAVSKCFRCKDCEDIADIIIRKKNDKKKVWVDIENPECYKCKSLNLELWDFKCPKCKIPMVEYESYGCMTVD